MDGRGGGRRGLVGLAEVGGAGAAQSDGARSPAPAHDIVGAVGLWAPQAGTPRPALRHRADAHCTQEDGGSGRIVG